MYISRYQFVFVLEHPFFSDELRFDQSECHLISGRCCLSESKARPIVGHTRTSRDKKESLLISPYHYKRGIILILLPTKAPFKAQRLFHESCLIIH